MTWSVLIDIGQKAGFFSLIRLPAAMSKKAKTQVASFARLGRLARYCRLPGRFSDG
jgi:hypothetical protein